MSDWITIRGNVFASAENCKIYSSDLNQNFQFSKTFRYGLKTFFEVVSIQ